MIMMIDIAKATLPFDQIKRRLNVRGEELGAISSDQAAIGMINRKTTAVRIIQAPGKGVGESVEFGGLLGRAPVMALATYRSEAFIARGGRIPAPIQALNN